ncbi:hypothetical protein LTR96_011977, partial [Exophiala xenobiotica]
MGSGDPEKPNMADKAVTVLTQINLVILPISIGIGILTYAYHTICPLIYVESRPRDNKRLPINTRKNWLIRLPMLLGIAVSTAGGRGAFKILATWNLAHVKPIEYAIIVVPVQISLGMFLGTIAQFKMEKRLARKEAVKLDSAKHEAASTNDKAGF